MSEQLNKRLSCFGLLTFVGITSTIEIGRVPVFVTLTLPYGLASLPSTTSDIKTERSRTSKCVMEILSSIAMSIVGTPMPPIARTSLTNRRSMT